MPNKNTESYSFRGQRSNESVLLVSQQHIWVVSAVFLFWLIFIGLLITMMTIWGASKVISYTIFIGVGLGLIYSLYRWYLWSNGVYIITSQRVIEMTQKSLFHRSIAEAELEKIQEITTDIKGAIPTFLNFGSVFIQTASSSSKIELKNIPDPYDVQQVIVSAQKDSGIKPSITSDIPKDED